MSLFSGPVYSSEECAIRYQPPAGVKEAAVIPAAAAAAAA
jgi:hypothetical protein